MPGCSSLLFRKVTAHLHSYLWGFFSVPVITIALFLKFFLALLFLYSPPLLSLWSLWPWWLSVTQPYPNARMAASPTKLHHQVGFKHWQYLHLENTSVSIPSGNKDFYDIILHFRFYSHSWPCGQFKHFAYLKMGGKSYSICPSPTSCFSWNNIIESFQWVFNYLFTCLIWLINHQQTSHRA